MNGLSRHKGHRDLMIANMACSLIEHKRINTTVTKAKVLKRFVEPLITRAKDDSTPSRRAVFRRLQQKEAVTELFREIGPKVGDRPGGYCRILRTGFRQGDGAEMCMIELVDYNENMLQDTSAKKKKSRRSRRGGAKKAATAVAGAADAVAEKAADAVEDAKEAASDAADAVAETAHDAVEEVKEVASDAAEAVSDVADDVKEAASDAVDAAKDAVKGEGEEE